MFHRTILISKFPNKWTDYDFANGSQMQALKYFLKKSNFLKIENLDKI